VPGGVRIHTRPESDHRERPHSGPELRFGPI
jgi:hypothetical protein